MLHSIPVPHKGEIPTLLTNRYQILKNPNLILSQFHLWFQFDATDGARYI